MQRKATPQSRAPNAAEKRWMSFVKGQSNCWACGQYGPVEGHHVVGSAGKEKVNLVTVLIGHWFVIALCPDCHSLAGFSKLFRDLHGRQSRIWAERIGTYASKNECPDEVYQGVMKNGR